MKKLRIALTAMMLVALLLIAVSAVFAQNPALQVQHHQLRNVTKWTHGNINKTNSEYFEGDSIPYRYEFDNVPAGACIQMEIHYDFSRGTDPNTKYAFDFLTDVKRTEGTIIDGLTGRLFSSPQTPLTGLADPDDCDFEALQIPDDPTHAFDDDPPLPQQYFTLCGNYASAAVVSGPTLVTSPGGNTEKVIALKIQATGGTGAKEIAIAWGGHLARGLDWGTGKGAGSISGSPYHMRGKGFLDLNCNDVQQLPDDKNFDAGDLDVKVEAETPLGTIIIHKDADFESEQAFPFESNIPGHENFSLVDNGTGLQDTITFSGLIPGDYKVTELVPDDWNLVKIVCSDPDDGTDVDLDETKASIDLDPEETVECTFFNDPQPGTIIVEKQTNPDGAPDSFTFSGDAAGTISDGGQIVVSSLQPGTYTSQETVPQGWNLTSIECDDDESATPSTWDVGTRTATFNLDPGETVKCTFTNTKKGKPAAIDLASFTAQAGAGGVTLAWETGTELDNAGFNLYRATSADGPYTQINDALIAAEGDPVSGASYSFVDAPGYGTFYYQLEDVDYNGVSTMHGPVKVTVARPFRRPLYRPRLPEF